ncbi:Inhibin alpha chain [Merluccius polli]|uniref:Inhibin alpha chain n=1 Tax=Merluccius polli TaxID=89951 RepID=A0AA47NUI4_MERPO|nr:Inhibin alpha chain [Merluccius polli]
MLHWLVWVLLLVLGTGGAARACPDAELPREVALALFKDRLLGRMGLEEAPTVASEFLPRGPGWRPRRSSRAAGAENHREQHLDTSQIIMFPSSESPCSSSSSTVSKDGKMAASYRFRPANNHRELAVTSAHFWFHAGPASNSSAPLYISTSARPSVLLAKAPSSATTSDGWTTYDLLGGLSSGGGGAYSTVISSGPFVLQVRCSGCPCRCRSAADPGKTPFLHLHVRPRAPSGRSPRHTAAIPWSPFAVDLLQRPSGRPPPENSDCRRDEVTVSFDELGWGSWIVHPKVVAFRYCRGNCSSGPASLLGMRRCCAPVPESMRSLRITTTSDGGYSFKYETLPNIIAEQCTCV